MKNKSVTYTKVVSKNIILDYVAKFQNMFGLNLTGYEKMIEKAKNQIYDDIKKDKVKLKWYRYEITELTNGAIAIMLYGDVQ